jgi:ribonuclease R
MDKLKTQIIEHLSNGYADAVDLNKISSDLKIKKEDVGKFESILQQLEQEGIIIITKKRKAVLTDRAGYLAGTFSCTDKGYGFVINDNLGSGDLFVAQKFFKGAMHGDFVLAKITKPYSENRQPEGEIIKVLKRNTKIIVGKFEKNKNFGYVVADNKKIIDDIYIPKKHMMNEKNLQEKSKKSP